MSYYIYVPISTDNQLLVFSMDADSGQLERKHQIALSKSGSAVAADPKAPIPVRRLGRRRRARHWQLYH